MRRSSERLARPIKLLVCSHNLSQEGASISLKELICGLARRHTIEAQVFAFGDGPLRQEYEAQGVAVRVLPWMFHKLRTPKRLDCELDTLAAQIRASGADLVFVNTLLNFPAILAAERAGLASIWNPRESEPWNLYFAGLPDTVAQQAIAAIGLPRKVVFVAAATQAVWQTFEAEAAFTVIHNALNLQRFAPVLATDSGIVRRELGFAEQEVVFLCVGTVCERKGQQDIVLALQECAGRLAHPVRVVFAGDASSSYANQMKRFAAQCALSDRIRLQFVEATHDIGRYYRAADVFVLCSRVESYPRVVLEALAFGLPVVTTRVFGVAEQLPAPDDALFYEPGDGAALAKHLALMTNDVALRRQYAQRAQSRFASMPSFDQMLDAYTSVIEEAVAGG